MADQQPGEKPPAAGMPEPTRFDDGTDPSTVDAPARWSGAAPVPPPQPRKAWWQRRDRAEEPPTEEWGTAPAVDPWADQDTPWDAFPLVPDVAPPMPPTRVEAPAPTRLDEPPAPSPQAPPPQAPPPQAPPPQAPQPAAAQPTGTRPTTPPPAAPPRTPKASRRDRKAAAKALREAARRLPRPPQSAPTGLPAGGPPAGLPASGPVMRGRPLPAPPPWAPRQAARPMPPPPRRKRRWGRRIALLSLLSVACCCGLPFAWYRTSALEQYPVTAVFPKSIADLQLRDTETNAQNEFAGEYADRRGKRVTVFGITGFRLTPGADVEAHLERVTSEYGLKNVQEFDLGESGAHERCGVGRDDGASVVVCAWADHGSLATVLLTRRSVADSAELVARLRAEVLTPG